MLASWTSQWDSWESILSRLRHRMHLTNHPRHGNSTHYLALFLLPLQSQIPEPPTCSPARWYAAATLCPVWNVRAKDQKSSAQGDHEKNGTNCSFKWENVTINQVVVECPVELGRRWWRTFIDICQTSLQWRSPIRKNCCRSAYGVPRIEEKGMGLSCFVQPRLRRLVK